MAARRKKGAEESLTTALARLLEKTILPDLDDRARMPAVAAALAEQHAREVADRRTADTLAEWRPRWLEQIGAAWVLSCVFVRTLEDRGLVRRRRIAGEGAADAEHLFFDLTHHLSARDYLLVAFREVARYPGAEGLLGPAHNPAFRLSPSNEGARALLDFFREPAEGGSGLRWRFEGTDTRFLGDLYQDLSASVRERYALLQTLGFVEEFILDLTLEPAIHEYGLEETHLIDPTCGSGHFLLGAFERICEHRMRTQPGIDAKVHAWSALAQVHGVDVNPYAAAIARFRLTLAYLAKAEITSLAKVPRGLPIEVVVADSLLHGANETTGWLPGMAPPMFELEDDEGAARVLGRRYHAVVGNPPYITCKDPALREAYRERYVSAAGKYALAAPFTERFFQLAVEGGYVGLINANSFMKREFGKKLIEEVLKHLDLTRVIDTSGAYIPGHGTPTVLLFGRNQRPVLSTVRAVLGKRGEPETPKEAKEGKVWSAIETHFDDANYEDDFISTAVMSRETLARHPWSLGGGGAADLKQFLERQAGEKLGDMAVVGVGGMSNADDIYISELGGWARRQMPSQFVRSLVIGEEVRDWSPLTTLEVFFPYDNELKLSPLSDEALRLLWPFRSTLWARAVFGGGTYRTSGRPWWEWHQVTADRYRTSLSITYAEVATHNHFVLDRGGKVFKQTAPIIKLPKEATEDDHLALLGYLNSSTACFWMKQVCTPKANHTEERPEKGIPDWARFAFSSTAVGGMPLPDARTLKELVEPARKLDQLARERQQNEPSVLIDRAARLDNAQQVASFFDEHEGIDRDLLEQMVCVQEDLDWIVYHGFGLCTKELARSTSREARLSPDQRPFSGEAPSSLTGADAALFSARRSAIAASSELRMMENLVCKRKWMGGARGSFALKAMTYRERAEKACLEHAKATLEQVLARGMTPMSSRALRSALDGSTMTLVAFGLGGGGGTDQEIAALLAEESIPYLAALRYTAAALETGAHLGVRAQWERTWDLQRREDAGEEFPEPIPVPEKYDAKDFLDPSYFRLRGKLDVPRERFISYPGAEKDDDRSPLFGWAGWTHLERAGALARLYQNRKTEEGWGADRLTPLLAGILELVPWVKQWHNEMNEEFGERLGDYYERYVDTETRALGLTLDALRAWRPEARTRKPRTKKAAS